MAYGNWGAFVYRNGERQTSHEDADVANDTHHAVLGSGAVILTAYKHYPSLWRLKDGKPEQVEIKPFALEGTDKDWDDKIYKGEIDGFKFTATQYNGNMVDLWLQEPDGTQWQSTCGYCYGAGHMD